MDDDLEKKLEALEHVLADANAEPIPLSYACLRKVTNDFSQEIGRGGFGVVYMGNLQNGKVAVKKLTSLDFFEEFEDELLCLIRVKHKNIVRFLGYCSDTSKEAVKHGGDYVVAEDRKRYLCFEYVPNKSLKEYLEDEYSGCRWDTTYQLIEGICHGLRYLHNEERIIHLDLKPENILLDANMVPKITDFGLSRRFVNQSRKITEYVRGTLGYIAPEYINNKEISFKTDIYSLGIVMWHKSVVLDNPQVKRCVKIAQLCVDTDQRRRPTVDEIIGLLNEKESVITLDGNSRCNSGSSIEEVSSDSILLLETEHRTVHSASEVGGTDKNMVREKEADNELLEFQPPELRFHFEANKLIPCPLNLINRTDQRVAFMLYPGKRKRYFTKWLCGVVPPRSTYTLTVTMKKQKQPPQEDEFVIKHCVVTNEELTDTRQGKPGLGYKNFFMEVEKVDVDIVRTHSMIAVCDPQAGTTSEVMSTKEFGTLYSIDVHPTKPWIVTGHSKGQVYIWNCQKKEMVNSFEVTKDQEVLSVKFIPIKEWILAGGGDACIYVYSYDSWKMVKTFQAHNNQMTSLAIHPDEPYVLSASHGRKIKLWDWENGWNNESRQKFLGHTGSVTHVVFNPKDAKAFASVSEDGMIKVWSIDYGNANFTLHGHMSNVRCLDYFRHGDAQILIAGFDDGTAEIWDLHKKERVETLKGHTARINAVFSHPDRPILMTGSSDGTVRLWNSISFRLQGILNFVMRKVYALACMEDSRRIVIGHSDGIAIMDIDHYDTAN